jgi:hypothetical protein
VIVGPVYPTLLSKIIDRSDEATRRPVFRKIALHFVIVYWISNNISSGVDRLESGELQVFLGLVDIPTSTTD